MASQGSSTSSFPIIRPATPSNSKKIRQKFGSWVRGSFSKSKSRGAEPAPPGIETAQAQNPQATSIVAQDTLLVRMESIDFKEETIDTARKVAVYKLAIAAIDIFQSVVEYTEFGIPNAVGKVLERLTKVLDVLKQMVENEMAWKELLLTLNDHAAQFNEQLVRMNQANTKSSADSPVLAPLKDYSIALEKLTAKIILECGLVQQDSMGDAGWEKIKRFTTTYISVDSKASRIETYRRELRDVMQMLSHHLAIYVAFTAGYISEQLGSSPAMPGRNIIAKRPPEVSPHFVAREKEWKFIVVKLVSSTEPGRKSLSITGTGGCGKTQLVSYFLKEKKDLFTHVVYVDASSKATIEADLRAWAQSLGDGHEKDDWDNALSLLTDERWAYILDNADDPELDLSPFLASLGDGTIIITSRNRKVINYTQHHLPMGEMTEEEALSTLVKAAGRRSSIPAEELESACTLAKELRCLALALAHAGAYCHYLSSDGGSVFTFTRYLKHFHSHRAELMEKPGPPTFDGYKLVVYATLYLSYDKLPQRDREILRLISNFHYSDIPMEMLVAAAETRFEDPERLLPRPDGHEASVSRLITLLGTDRSESEFQTEAVVSTLRSFSLVSTTFIGGSMFLQIHPLVQAWARDMKSSDAEDYRIMATQILTSCSIYSNINIYHHLLPHIIEKLKDNHGSSLHVNDQAALGDVLLEMGRYSAAEVLFLGTHKSLWIIAKEDTKNTLWVTGRLAATYAFQGRYDEAKKLGLEVLEKRRTVLGSEHLDSILAAANLAETYHDQGQYDEAEKLELEVLEKRRKILGADHPDTVKAAANLACTYRSQGRYDEAEKLEVEVLEKRRKILGDDHPETVIAAANLACTYHEQGRYTDSEKLELEVLEKRRKILGDDHPDTIMAAAILAGTYPHRSNQVITPILDPETAPSIPTRLTEEHQRTIERVRLWYPDSGPLAKKMNEAPALSITGHSYRVQLVALNFEFSRTSMMVDRNSTYSDIGFQLKTHGVAALPVALEQINGPISRWRIPDIDSKVPQGLQKIYVVDLSEPFTMALVRDVEKDFPLLLSLSSFNDTTTTFGDLIGAKLDGRVKSWASIRLLSSSHDIQGLPCQTVQKEIKGVHSTTILVLLTDDPLEYKFRNLYNGRVPPPLQVAFPQFRSLVEYAPRLKAFTFQAIDFSRALLHLAICLAEAAIEEKIEGALQVYLISRLKNMAMKLGGIFTNIENSTDNLSPAIAKSLHLFFYQLCEEQPGVVAVRQSLESLQALIALDPQTQGSSSEITGMNLLVREEDSVEQDGTLLSVVTSRDSSGLDGSASSDSLSSSDHESSSVLAGDGLA